MATADLRGIPIALADSVAADAERDALAVGAFLLQLANGDSSLVSRATYPARFYLGLGFALRIDRWERAGISIHLAAGLPPARKLMMEVHDWSINLPPEEGDALVQQLGAKVIQLAATRLAWNQSALDGADILLGGQHTDTDRVSDEKGSGDVASDDDTALLEAVARYLWERRRSRSNL